MQGAGKFCGHKMGQATLKTSFGKAGSKRDFLGDVKSWMTRKNLPWPLFFKEGK
jgi:hypothetical protein